jgi:Xaa-Pro aminopeptidase
MSDQTKQIYQERVEALQAHLNRFDLDAIIIPHDDEYLSYELNESQERIKYISGFTGSAGYVVVLKAPSKKMAEGKAFITLPDSDRETAITKTAAVFVDGRYVVQVKEQIDSDLFMDFNFQHTPVSEFLCAVLDKNSKVGIDLHCISYNEYKELQKDLKIENIELKETETNLVDAIWTDKPEPVISKFYQYADEYNGCPSPQKRRALAQKLRARDLDATVICDPESICWLLNIRGEDRKYIPIINCRMVAYSNEALEWYIHPNHIDENIIEDMPNHIGHVDIFPEDRFDDVLERLCSSSSSVFVDPNEVSAHVLNRLYEGGANVVEGLGLCQTPKACKNHVEVAGEYKAHIKDGIAMCRFLSWLDVDVLKLNEQAENEDIFVRRVENITEATLAERAEYYRKVEAAYMGPSFATISALGPNAAMCHYNHEEVAEPRKLGEDSIYLIDSGAHFKDGTTDITRTVLVGPHITDEIKRMYTLVLKAHISLATLVFPRGTSGLQIDAIARRPLWDYGLDFAHGTGHGVGHVLSVHEGPQAISTKRSTVPLEPGMIISNEPGYYKEGEYGIRLENLLVVMHCTQPGMTHMLCFSPLTLVPFDNRLIVKDLLSQSEIDWLNNYHQNVNNVISNAATTLSDTEIGWLSRATAAI